MLITIAMCTWNNCTLLEMTLNNLVQNTQSFDGAWELIVVNNNSTDDTESVLAMYRDRLPMRAVFEPKPGLSNARNRAVAEGRGAYFLWLDDDVLVGQSWLESYASAFANFPEAAVFGGPVEPFFEGTPPSWLEKGFPSVRKAYACIDHGPKPKEFSGQSILIVGANFAVRRKEQLENLYDPTLGVRGSLRLGGEEHAVVERILKQKVGRWLPTARVQHFIPRKRQSVSWLKGRCEGSGATQFLINKQRNGHPKRLIARLVLLSRHVLGLGKRWARYLLSFQLNECERLSRLQAYWRLRGYLKAFSTDVLNSIKGTSAV